MQHYTRNTVEASAWCKKCGKATPHRVDGVKLGACIPCLDKLNADADARKAGAPAPEQMTMWREA